MNKILVYVLNNGSTTLLSRTEDSLKKQTDLEFTTVISDGCKFWEQNRNLLAPNHEYTLFLYSGSVLSENAIEQIKKALNTAKPYWLYFDERTYDAEWNNNIHEVFEKPDFGAFLFLNSVYTGEGVVFSREALLDMQLVYSGTNFGVSIAEMTISAAVKHPGLHVRQNLLVRHNRPTPSAKENALLMNGLRKILAGYIPEARGKQQKNTVGLKLFPRKYMSTPFSVIVIEDQTTNEDAITFGDYEGLQYISVSGKSSYLSKCITGIKSADSDVILVVGGMHVLPSGEELAELAAFAGMKDVGFVSPCLHNGDSVIYTGNYDYAGIRTKIERSGKNWKSVQEYLYSIRETILPAWEFWGTRKELALEVLESFTVHHCDTAISPEELMIEIGYALEERGKKSVYVGTVLAECSQDYTNNCDSFIRLLYSRKDRFFLDPYCPVQLRQALRNDTLKNINSFFPDYLEPYDPKKKSIFVFTHELSLTGAPVVLSHAVRVLKEAGYQIVVGAPSDGPLMKNFLRLGVPVVILGNTDNRKEWIDLVSNFDLLLLNTIVLYKQIDQLKNRNIPVLWWLHDARSGYEAHLKNVLPKTLGDNIFTYSVSKYADDVVTHYRPEYVTGLLRYGLVDVADKIKENELPFEMDNDQMLIVTVGTLVERKGQDILAKAIRLLPENTRKKCMFLFIGKPIDHLIVQAVTDLQSDYPDCVKHITAVNHDDIFNLYKKATAVICPSRDDPLPTYMAETMMVSGVCICSENTGTAGVIQNGFNGYVYSNDDPQELADCIELVVSNNALDALRIESRKTFENNFSLDVFRKNLLNYVSDAITEKRRCK